jgi:hypothetical protein
VKPSFGVQHLSCAAVIAQERVNGSLPGSEVPLALGGGERGCSTAGIHEPNIPTCA